MAKKPRNTRADSHLSWELYQPQIPRNLGTCSESQTAVAANASKHFLPLMHHWVTSVNRRPLLYSNNYKFHSINIHSSQNFTQLFITTQNLRLLKISVQNGQVKSSMSVDLPKETPAKFQEGLFDDNFTYFVKTFDKFVFVGTTWTVYRAPRSLCVQYSSCEDCLRTSQDPECLWNSKTSRCGSMFDTEFDAESDLSNDVQVCPIDGPSQNVTYQVTFLRPVPSEQLTNPVAAASDVTLFCGAQFLISKTTSPSASSFLPAIPAARWYENSRDVSQSVGSCGSVGVNVLSCYEVQSKTFVSETSISSSKVEKSLNGFTYSILKISSFETANYTCVFHYSPKDFISNSVVLRVQSRKQQADQIFTDYLHELKEYYTRKCELKTYCRTDGCNVDTKDKFHRCLNEQMQPQQPAQS